MLVGHHKCVVAAREASWDVTKSKLDLATTRVSEEGRRAGFPSPYPITDSLWDSEGVASGPRAGFSIRKMGGVKGQSNKASFFFWKGCFKASVQIEHRALLFLWCYRWSLRKLSLWSLLFQGVPGRWCHNNVWMWRPRTSVPGAQRLGVSFLSLHPHSLKLGLAHRIVSIHICRAQGVMGTHTS
jgi:hypothetical protein